MSKQEIISAWREGTDAGTTANPAGDVSAELNQMFATQQHAQERSSVSGTRVCSGSACCI